MELAHKDFKAAILSMIKDVKEKISAMTAEIRNLSREIEITERTECKSRTEKYKIQNKKFPRWF